MLNRGGHQLMPSEMKFNENNGTELSLGEMMRVQPQEPSFLGEMGTMLLDP